jgi:hypothetical protein
MPEDGGEVTGTKDKDVALGLGAFGVYSVARAFVNRERAANTT